MKQQMKKFNMIYSVILITAIIVSIIGHSETVIAATKKLSAPSSVKAQSASYNSIHVSWSDVTGASGYAVSRSTSSNGSYSILSLTSKKSYKDTSLTTGRTYYYKIRAYKTSGKTRVYGNYSSIMKAKPLLSAPTSVKSSSVSYNSIKISWNSISGASGYAIYRATSSKGTFSYVTTTTATSYKNTNLSTGKSYYYKIKAYRTIGNVKVYSNYSSTIASKPVLTVPTWLKMSSSYNSITINWNKVSGASGYSIYRASSSSGSYSQMKTTSSATMSDSGLNSGTTYYYKVRAYRTVNGSKIYSNYSSVKNGTTQELSKQTVSLNKSSLTMLIGSTETLTASFTPITDNEEAVIWQSSNSAVATVDSLGTVTALSAGTATITAATPDGTQNANCVIVVNDGSKDTSTDTTNSNISIKGIDVSKWQGNINWSSVKEDGIKFAMIRSSYGSSSVDPMFETNYKSAKANGIAIGAYHYSYATTVAKAKTEVKFFISKLEGKQFEYPVCVDIEDPSQNGIDKNTLTEIVLVYLDELSKAGYFPMIYTNKTWYTTKLDDVELTSYDHWLAQWASSITYTGAVGIWQYTSSGTVSGISGRVDMNISYVDYVTKIKSLHLNGF